MELSTTTAIWLTLAVSLAMLLALFLRSGRTDLLPYVFAYLAFFGLGPAINYALGNEIYIGIVTDKIPAACLVLALALGGVTLVGLLMPVRDRLPDLTALGRTPRENPVLPVVLYGLAAYTLAILVTRGPAMLAADKLGRIELAGPLHTRYLVVEMCACSIYFLARAVRPARIAYWVNLGLYVLYCLATSERDFLFVLFAVVLHVLLLQRRRISPKFGIAGVAFVLAATYLSAVRSGDALNLSKVLNEGSTLFVDTFVLTNAADSLRLWPGESYLNGFLTAMPSALVPERPMLMSWLVDAWLPGSSSGFGFSLTAEAYANFGYLGVPVVFAALTLGHRLLFFRAAQGHVYAYASILYTISWMYGFRGESASLLATLLHGVAFYTVIWLGSLKGRSVQPTARPEARVPHGNLVPVNR
ncbi:MULTISPECIES: O-antigen polysaccharide polymerase Wzy [Micromonospora]|uniref:O-antigen polysaccharide polymerase Wzy n=1 Tax=Micromonospora aurantiaca (nom. illeg.) TaxID=47850 RepID=A0A6N3K0W2_9ACTN|nr:MULTISPECIES: O-antigen polysaccharide polymerase Wzy [Micromonospora]AXH91735.1 O-antigen polysaccharide polymerase Wzy [Micromonospora aurantiaca]